MKLNIYGIYRGDTFLDVGTLEELSQSMGIKKKTLSFYGTPTYKKRIKEWSKALVLVKI